MHISADYVTECEKFLFQLKALQKRVQKDVNKFIVPQAVPEIYRKNERLKNRGMCFFVIDCSWDILTIFVSQCSSVRFIKGQQEEMIKQTIYYMIISGAYHKNLQENRQLIFQNVPSWDILQIFGSWCTVFDLLRDTRKKLLSKPCMAMIWFLGPTTNICLKKITHWFPKMSLFQTFLKKFDWHSIH